ALAHHELPSDVAAAIKVLRAAVVECRAHMAEIATHLHAIISQCDRYIHEMDFAQLTDKRRNLLSVGYDATKQELASSCYDLLASEARIATFIAVAKGEADQETWFRLGRQHTVSEGESVP